MSSLRHHLADLHKIYQQQVVADELLEGREGVMYKVDPGCSVPPVQGGADKWLDDAKTFQGNTPS